MPLLARLLLLILIAVLPALAILLYNQHELRTAREAETHEEALRNAHAVDDELQRIVAGARDLLLTIAHAPAVRDANWADCNSYLEELGDAYPAYSRLTVADRTGRIVCASKAVSPDLSMEPRAHFQAALASGDFTVGTFAIGRSSGDAVLPFAAPFHDREGRLAGVVTNGLRLDWLAHQVERKLLPFDGMLLIADRDGTIVSRTPDPNRWIGRQLSETARPFFRADKPGTTEQVGVDGIRRVYGYVPVRASSTGLHVAVGIGTAQALRPIFLASDRGLVLVGFAGLVALVLAWLVADQFIRQPIRRLIAATYELGTGNYRCASRLDGAGEWRALSRAFDAMAQTLASREAALRESEERFRRLSEASFEGVVIHDGERVLEANAAAVRLFGYEPGEGPGMPLVAFLAPEARERAFAMARAEAETRYESVGLCKDGSTFPVEFRGRGVDYKGRRARIIVVRDLTEEKAAAAALSESADRLRLLAAEVDHRSKNMLALIQVILRHTRAATVPEYSAAVQGRVAALARAHTLLSQSRWEAADLRRLAEEELAPFRRDGDRVRLDGPVVALSSRAAQVFSMVLHELATNAAKYGALSEPGGHVLLEWIWREDEQFLLRWSESGGPSVQPPDHLGFGSNLIARSIGQQLQGQVHFDWRSEGLVCELVVPRNSIVR